MSSRERRAERALVLSCLPLPASVGLCGVFILLRSPSCRITVFASCLTPAAPSLPTYAAPVSRTTGFINVNRGPGGCDGAMRAAMGKGTHI
ncbi:hypothetical protein BDW02DRAFT_568737 [Decorospora gaudefroyi]|uniref:Uncharacterized protein n=1 Tax=Decorospora gaudefroyi TaxID=184978 RepID=A0A6A5KEZ0_9PLEO|nr:hypothetical protein BDW02DRAFT_568737 [Decorospora gaudefroyi]